MSDAIDALRSEYLRLTKTALPTAAKASKEPWPIRLDHCFMRVVLDNLFGRCWYDVLDRRRPAYAQLSLDQLDQAVCLARSMLEGGADRVKTLDDLSLTMRGKSQKRSHGPESANNNY